MLARHPASRAIDPLRKRLRAAPLLHASHPASERLQDRTRHRAPPVPSHLGNLVHARLRDPQSAAQKREPTVLVRRAAHDAAEHALPHYVVRLTRVPPRVHAVRIVFPKELWVVAAGVRVCDGGAGGDADGVDVEFWRGESCGARGVVLVWCGVVGYGGGGAGPHVAYFYG